VRIPTEFMGKFDKGLYDSLIGDKAYSMVFDNSKISGLCLDSRQRHTSRQGVRQILDWYAEDQSAKQSRMNPMCS